MIDYVSFATKLFNILIFNPSMNCWPAPTRPWTVDLSPGLCATWCESPSATLSYLTQSSPDHEPPNLSPNHKLLDPTCPWQTMSHLTKHPPTRHLSRMIIRMGAWSVCNSINYESELNNLLWNVIPKMACDKMVCRKISCSEMLCHKMWCLKISWYSYFKMSFSKMLL